MVLANAAKRGSATGEKGKPLGCKLGCWAAGPFVPGSAELGLLVFNKRVFSQRTPCRSRCFEKKVPKGRLAAAEPVRPECRAYRFPKHGQCGLGKRRHMFGKAAIRTHQVVGQTVLPITHNYACSLDVRSLPWGKVDNAWKIAQKHPWITPPNTGNYSKCNADVCNESQCFAAYWALPTGATAVLAGTPLGLQPADRLLSRTLDGLEI